MKMCEDNAMLSRIACQAIIVVLMVTPPALGEPPPYENFPAADFTRGEKSAPGEGFIGIFSHYRRFNKIYAGDNQVPNTLDEKHSRFTPTLIGEYRWSERFAASIKVHNAVIRTSTLDGTGNRHVDNLTAPGDFYVYGIYSPWRNTVHSEREYSFFDRRNLSIVLGGKADIGHEDPQIPGAPGSEFRRTATGLPGVHEAVVGAVYTGHINDRLWAYSYGQYLIPLDETVFGMRPGNRLESQHGISWLPNEHLQIFGQVGYIHEDQGSGGRFQSLVNKSGGTYWLFSPGLTVDMTNGYGLEFAVQFPIAGSVRGQQLVGGEDYFFGIYKAF